MCANGLKLPNLSSGFTGLPVRRLLDTNGARPWVWTAIGLAALWLVLVLHLPM